MLNFKATEKGFLNIVELLVQNKAEINAKDSNNENALSWGYHLFKQLIKIH